MAPLKKFRENLNKKIILLGLLLGLVGIVLGVYFFYKSQPSLTSTGLTPPSAANMAAVQKSRVNNGDAIRARINVKDWEGIKTDLADEHKFSQVLTEIQKAIKSPNFPATDSQALFKVMKEDLQTHSRSARDWNLITRVFSFFDLNKDQAKDVRELAKKVEARLRANLLFQAFLGTVPYPADLKQNLIKDLHDKDVSQAREALYFVSLMKDNAAAHQIYTHLVKSYSSLNKNLKPFVAKTLIYSQDEEILHSPGFEKIKKHVHLQSGDLWKEVQAAYDSKANAK